MSTRKSGTAARRVSPWKHTERDRGYQRRKAAADERAAVHVYTPGSCKDGCADRLRWLATQ